MTIQTLIQQSQNDDTQAAFNLIYTQEIFAGVTPIDAEINAQFKLGLVEKTLDYLE